jgi:Zn-dependent metalloprotease
MPLGQLQALPQSGKPVVKWGRQALAWANVAEGVANIVKNLRLGKTPPRAAARPIVPAVARKPLSRSPVIVDRANGHLHRIVSDAKNKDTLPGTVVRKEGLPPTGDEAADEAYDGLGATYRFFWNVYERDSIDGKGLPIKATVHYSKDFNNAFWDGTQIAWGDGDGRICQRLTQDVDQIAARYVYGINQCEANLTFWRQSGALLHSMACVFASLVKQYTLGQRVDEADWLLGTRILGKALKGRGICSLAAPGTAYHDPAGHWVDDQPGHMSSYVQTQEDFGGVHVNSGIPNRAFYLAATAIGGYSWDKTGRIGYETLCGGMLKADTTFKAFSELTLAQAQRRFGRRSAELSAVRFGWEMVGVKQLR